MEEKERLIRAVPLLLEWYGVSKRDLPWRGTKDPYRILVSETMLQQTRIETAKGYFSRFLQKFPTASSLAEADEGEVLKAWEGLGYYTRARNLHKAAKIVAKEGFPSDFRGVRALPGVGDYTAGAILSIAYDLPYPAVDGNVLRVLTRLFADSSVIDDPKVKARFFELLKEVTPAEAGDFCQALMELGEILCLPNGEPSCPLCPWESLCLARLSGSARLFPVRAEKKERRTENLFVYVLWREGKYALRKREEGLLKGLWEFPNSKEELYFGRVLEEKHAFHIFTHVRWNMLGRLISAEEFFPQFVWATGEEIKKTYALPSAFKAFRSWTETE